MKSRPIIYSPDMVRAKRAGLKTQTRRLVKPQPEYLLTDPPQCQIYHPAKDGEEEPGPPVFGFYNDDHGWPCPYGQPGDLLWTRETHQLQDVSPHGYPECLVGYKDGTLLICGPADDDVVRPLAEDEKHLEIIHTRWRPSIHMPRWACRSIDLITAIRVERLQDITEADAIAEGVSASEGIEGTDTVLLGRIHQNLYPEERLIRPHLPITRYAKLWESIHGPGSWAANPYVWVITFEPYTPASTGN